MANTQVPGSPGRRLRLQRRKSLLDQAGLAKILGTSVEEISAMENNRAPLSSEAAAFVADPPQKVPASTSPPRPRRGKAKPEPGGEGSDLGEPSLPNVEEQVEGAGPRVEPPPAGPEDKRPRAQPSRDIKPLPREADIEELERALRIMFAGETFLVPREQPDGTIQHVEAVVPGLAQLIGTIDEFDGMVIRTYAPGMAKAWADLARENATVRKILIGITYGGAYRGVVAASLPPLMAIAAHHGALGLGRPQPVVEHRAEQPQENGAGPVDPFAPPEFIENGDGTWTHPGTGQLGVFGPQGWMPLDQATG